MSKPNLVKLEEEALRKRLHELTGEHKLRYVGFDVLGLKGEVYQCLYCDHVESHRGPGY